MVRREAGLSLREKKEASTLAKLREYASKLEPPLVLSAAAETRTIKGTLEEMTKFQTKLWWQELGASRMCGPR